MVNHELRPRGTHLGHFTVVKETVNVLWGINY